MFKTKLFEQWYDREMLPTCAVCQQSFEPEPGFYYGAMFVSYAFSVAITFVVGFVLFNFFNDPELWVYMITLLGVVGLVWPLMYRYSRAIFLHIFGGIRFDSKYAKE
ncbi:DUF983 domain-containing protein [Reichenbachiella agarivorans]|uniref:DUF983 domain-containing protein n=1 Tax=Reichenbachiella agarivorans TaxID=2979464 RepID=A0ABY6CQS4_9BACT|nr:DUF983 domain-containing protein [Reichenbachiella agarivorans]UXP32874.1 DUF983 domain-containing protein [Reichenbachiella agarivorans]